MPSSSQGYQAAPSPAQQGYADPAGPESRGFIAPPRTEYDYSPLDLAPPAQRRKRQLVGGIIAALALIVLGALAVFGYLLTRDDKPSEAELLAPTQTAIAAFQATSTAEVAQNAVGTPSANETVAATEPAAGTQPATGGQPTTASTQPAQQGTSSGPSQAALAALLPEASALPVTGLDVVEDSSLTEEQVVAALGGTRPAEQNLETWGWSGNATRSYSAADPASLDPTATTAIVISVHGFNSPESAQAALTFFSDILVNSGYEEIDAPQLGDKVRLLKIPNEDGSTNVALYVTKGNVMYRIGGSAGVGGDPTDAVEQVAQSLLGADTGQ
ncbi:MAG TPA: hypothetical protein VNP95_08680 [Thermomicrobiales bacterium]|nr:hypothetical protein [Thermomicrobiales bacterium]